MASFTLLTGVAIGVVTTAVYIALSVVIMKRSEAIGEGGALRAFALWWGGIGALTAINGARDLLAALGALDPTLLETLLHLSIPPLSLGLWGLFYYLGYIFVGRRRLFVPSVALYTAVHVILVYIIVTLDPVGATVRMWDVQVEYRDGMPPALTTTLVALLIVPILVAVLGYMALFFRVHGIEQKFRIGMVSLAFVVWFGGSFLVTLTGLARLEWWGLAGRLLGLGSALLVLVAYNPPARVRARLQKARLRPLGDARTEERYG